MERKFDPRGFIGDLCFVSVSPIPKDGGYALKRVVTSYDAVRKEWTALREDGSLCSGWKYVAPIPPAKPAKPAPKAKWEPIDLFAGMPRIAIGSPWHIALSEAERKINQLGAENAKLKNQLAKLKGSK